MAGKQSWKLNEVVVLVVLSVAVGVLFWGWTFVDALVSAPLKPFGINYILAGVWFIGGTLIPFLIRKPGSALAGEVLAAIVEGFITHWGITAAIWGAVQGIGAESVFFATGYKNWDIKTMIAAGAVSGFFSYMLDFFYSQYWTLKAWVIVVQLVCAVLGGILWAGIIGYALAKGIIKTGAAANLLSGEDLA